MARLGVPPMLQDALFMGAIAWEALAAMLFWWAVATYRGRALAQEKATVWACGVNLALWAANLVFIDGKMRALFSMLFGASTLLVIQRAEAAGESGAKVHYSRMFVLFAIGWLHYHLIWWGDILKDYAFTGCIAFFWRRASVKKLLAWAIGFYLLGMLVFTGFIYSFVQADIAAHAPGATAKAIAEWNDFAQMAYPTATEVTKDLALHRGSWGGIAHYWVVEKPFSWVQGMLVFTPETLGLYGSPTA